MWTGLFFLMAVIMPHKEDRMIIPIVPAMCLISGLFLSKIKKYRRIILIVIIGICCYFLYSSFNETYHDSYTLKNMCFLKENSFLKSTNKTSMVVTDESSLVYYYSEKETRFYTNPWSVNGFKNAIKKDYETKDVYVLIPPNSGVSNTSSEIVERDVSSIGKRVFECEGGGSIYILELG